MVADGEYTIEVELTGGSGKAFVQSPTKLSVTDGKMQAEIEWSSSHYDYMEVDSTEYYPINDEGNSIFLIDINSLDSDIPIIAETTAMSEPHLIEYTLHFDSSTLKSESNNFIGIGVGCLCAVIVLGTISAILIRKKKLNDKK